MRGRQLPAEQFAMRSYREAAPVPAPVSGRPRWARPHFTKLADQDAVCCKISMLAWNGDRARGWTTYCACGYCAPMRRSFSDVMELLEDHWQTRSPA
jgi:hypothetical protein